MKNKFYALALINLALGMEGAGSSIVPSNQAMQVAQAISQTNGIIDLRGSMPIELYDKPTTSLLTSKGRNAADNANGEVQAYAFNEDAYNVSELTADGAAGYLVTYNDGFTGKNLRRHICFDNAGRGLAYNQLTITAKDSNGDQDVTLIENMQLTILTYTVIGGREKPVVVDLASAIRNTQFQSGIVTILLDGWVNSQTQFSWIVGSGATITVLVNWDQRK